MKLMIRPSVVLAAISVIACAATTGTMSTGSAAMASPSGELQTAMRKLWADHVLWTRQYIVSTVLNDPSAQAASVRLLKNQEDIGNAVVPYYGAAAGAKLTDLLKRHILIAVDLVAAAKASDAAKQADADRRWHQNAADIATFLSGANPNLPKGTLVSLLGAHVAHHVAQIQAVHNNQFDQEAANWGVMRKHMNTIADALAAGIAKQFPDKF